MNQANEDTLYEVEEIRSKKIQDGKIFYEIKWVGFDECENTYEPEENLVSIIHLIEKFEIKQKSIDPFSIKSYEKNIFSFCGASPIINEECLLFKESNINGTKRAIKEDLFKVIVSNNEKDKDNIINKDNIIENDKKIDKNDNEFQNFIYADYDKKKKSKNNSEDKTNIGQILNIINDNKNSEIKESQFLKNNNSNIFKENIVENKQINHIFNSNNYANDVKIKDLPILSTINEPKKNFNEKNVEQEKNDYFEINEILEKKAREMEIEVESGEELNENNKVINKSETKNMDSEKKQSNNKFIKDIIKEINNKEWKQLNGEYNIDRLRFGNFANDKPDYIKEIIFKDSNICIPQFEKLEKKFFFNFVWKPRNNRDHMCNSYIDYQTAAKNSPEKVAEFLFDKLKNNIKNKVV